jgi:hypothetical protein
MARVLLDENIAHMLRNALQSSIPHHEVVTASYAGFAGLKNGALLTAALDGGFDGPGDWPGVSGRASRPN